MLIGALHGRTRNGVDDHVCLELAAAYRNAFVQEFGCSECRALLTATTTARGLWRGRRRSCWASSTRAAQATHPANYRGDGVPAARQLPQ